MRRRAPPALRSCQEERETSPCHAFPRPCRGKSWVNAPRRTRGDPQRRTVMSKITGIWLNSRYAQNHSRPHGRATQRKRPFAAPRAVAAIGAASTRPAFEAHESVRQRRNRRAAPADASPRSTGPEADTLVLHARVAIATNPALPRVFDAEDTDRAHEVEFRAADVGIRGTVCIAVITATDLDRGVVGIRFLEVQVGVGHPLHRPRRDPLEPFGPRFSDR